MHTPTLQTNESLTTHRASYPLPFDKQMAGVELSAAQINYLRCYILIPRKSAINEMAVRNGFSPAYINHVCTGRTPITRNILPLMWQIFQLAAKNCNESLEKNLRTHWDICAMIGVSPSNPDIIAYDHLSAQ